MTFPPEPIGTPEAPFSLLETMRLQHGTVTRLERHLSRMRASAEVFGFPWREDAVRAALAAACAPYPEETRRVRLLVNAAGDPSVTCTPHTDSAPGTVWRIAFANTPVDDRDPRLFNKTTDREPYEIARRSRPDVDDVVLWNARNEVTESTIANLVVEVDGVRCTPPVSSGLLAGVLRGELVDSGQITERVITRGQLARASRVWLVNSLRGWIEATLVR
jgi:para-aminobenzoate synthetase/4-amino-4-deoxychorismate lyase